MATDEEKALLLPKLKNQISNQMKKLILFSLAGMLSAGAMAQGQQQTSVAFNPSKAVNRTGDKNPAIGVMAAHKGRTTVGNTAAKPTMFQERWYSYYNWVDQLNGGSLSTNSFLMSMWFDSTIVVNYTSGPGPVNYSSLMQVMDPVSNANIFNNSDVYPDDAYLGAGMPYSVDSINVFGSYIREITRPGNVVDTLILSVAPSAAAYRFDKNVGANGPLWAPYLDNTHDTLVALTQLNVDSVNRTILSDDPPPAAITWKVPLTVDQGDTADAEGQVSVRAWTYAVPNGGLSMPAGGRFAMSVTFKSGDTWTANVDSINGMHRFLPLVGETGSGAQMPYYYYDYGDNNMTNLMFSTDPSRYLPSVVIEAVNTDDFYQEFAAFDAYITWDDASTGVKNVNNTFTATAVPNPATSTFSVPVTLKSAGTVSVTLTNTMGQQVATQNLGSVAAGARATATFNTAALASGVYFYTVEVNGQRKTNRVVVSH